MREIQRTIVSALIWSHDNKLLMGRKDPSAGGVYSDCWHIPGGGVDEGETFEQALKREIQEEVGIDISPYKIVPIPFVGSGVAEKTLKSGEKVLCKMEFNRFEVRIDKNAQDLELHPTDDLVEMKWFGKGELPHVKQIPGGKDFFQQAGYLKKEYGLFFWLHLILLIPAYLAPLLFGWKLIILGVLVLQLQFWITGGCVLTHLQFGRDSNETFIWYYLRKLYPALSAGMMKIIIRVVVPAVLIGAGYLWQVSLGHHPILF